MVRRLRSHFLQIILGSVQELIAEEAANRQDIEDAIEEERAKVDAKTPITQTVRPSCFQNQSFC